MGPGRKHLLAYLLLILLSILIQAQDEEDTTSENLEDVTDTPTDSDGETEVDPRPRPDIVFPKGDENLPGPESSTTGKLIVFGDGFSDNGIDIESDDIHGIGTISNGQVWSDYLAYNYFNIDGNCKIDWRKNLNNYAYEGAGSGWKNKYFDEWTGLLWQIDRYFCCSSRGIPSDSIIILQMVGHEEIQRGQLYTDQSIVGNVISGLRTLLKRGAKKIIILGLVDPSKIPWYRARNPSTYPDIFSRNVQSVNNAVYNVLASNKCKNEEDPAQDDCYRGVYFTDDFMEKVQRKFEITNATLSDEMIGQNCITENCKARRMRGRYNAFDEYLWYDDSHLTTMGHLVLADVILKGINNIGKKGLTTPQPEEERFSRETLQLRFDLKRRARAKLRRDIPILRQLQLFGPGYSNIKKLPTDKSERVKILKFLQSPSKSEAERLRKQRVLTMFRHRRS